MKRTYIQPDVEVFDISGQNQILANSIPGGGEISAGGRDHLDSNQSRGRGWSEYEQ